MLLLTIEGDAKTVNVTMTQDDEPCGHFTGSPCEALADAAFAALKILTKERDFKVILRNASHLFSRLMKSWRAALSSGKKSISLPCPYPST